MSTIRTDMVDTADEVAGLFQKAFDRLDALEKRVGDLEAAAEKQPEKKSKKGKQT